MEYRVIKSWRKTMTLWIRSGKVIVKAPYLTPKTIIEAFVTKNRSWIEKRLEQQKNKPSLSSQDIQTLKKLAKDVIPNRVEQIAKKFWKTYNVVKITSAQTRWWSCTSQKNLNFSYRLMACPESVIDYVIIHELAHLKEMNHSQRFWKHVSEMKPDYKDDELWLKQNSGSIG